MGKPWFPMNSMLFPCMLPMPGRVRGANSVHSMHYVALLRNGKHVFIVFRNGKDVTGAEHTKIVELINESDKELKLKLITPYEAKMIDLPIKATLHSNSKTVSNFYY